MYCSIRYNQHVFNDLHLFLVVFALCYSHFNMMTFSLKESNKFIAIKYNMYKYRIMIHKN